MASAIWARPFEEHRLKSTNSVLDVPATTGRRSMLLPMHQQRPSAFFTIVDSKMDSFLCREHDVANQGFATLPTSLRILSSHVAVAAPGPDLVAVLRRKQLVLDALTSDMGMTPDLRCFNLSPGHVERGLCGTLTVRSASERSFYSVHKLRMTKTSETQSYTILRISSCNFKPIKATSKGVSYHFSNASQVRSYRASTSCPFRSPRFGIIPD